MFDSDMQIQLEPIPVDDDDRKSTDRMAASLICSLMLHFLVVLLLVFGSPWLMQAPPQVVRIVPINLVQLGEETTSPSSSEIAPLPQEKAKEVTKSESAQAVPAPQTPPPALWQGEERSTSDLRTAMKPAPGPTVPRPVKTPRPDGSPAADARRQSSPPDDLTARLNLMARLQQPPPVPLNSRQQEGTGASNVTATSADAARARDATYRVKDFIRAQVERRWNPKIDTRKSADWVVAIHIGLKPDGSVSLAEVVDTPRYHSDSAYRDFALSARNAVLLSSPLTIPAGDYDIAKDLVLDFNSKRAQQ